MSEVTVKPKTEAEVLFRDLDKPSLHALSYALRHPDTWPAGFVWDYSWCGQCAMGLAHKLWKTPRTNAGNGASVMAREFAMPFTCAQNIFLGKGAWVPTTEESHVEGKLWWKHVIHKSVTDWGAVTPEMVADQIDKYLETVE